MSKYEWETGSIILPTAAVSPLKKALREHANTFHEKVREEAVRLYRTAKGTRSVKTFRERILGPYPGLPQQSDPVKAAGLAVIECMVYEVNQGNCSIHVPTVRDVSLVVPKMTNRDDTFNVIDHWGSVVATITFHGREVKWEVEEGNRVVSKAHESPLGALFFQRLDRITWTRGTGGWGVGNDEYNRESDYAGGGGNYVTFTYGPLGEAEDAHSMGMSVAKYRALKEAARRPRW